MINLPTIDTSERLIHGSLLKCVDGRWSTQDTPDMTGRQLLALTTAKAIQRWQLKDPVETVVDAGTGLPDIEELNAKIPRAEWEPGLDGLPRPPWQLQYVVYLLDPVRRIDLHLRQLDSWREHRLGAFGRSRCLGCGRSRKLICFPLVLLDSKSMKTKMGVVKQRPEFTIIDWSDLSGGPAIAQQQQRAIEAKPATAKPAPVGKPVKAPPTTETPDDEIPF